MMASRLVLAVTLTIGLLAAPLAAEAQQPATKVYRIAYLAPGSPLSTLIGPEPSDPAFRAFMQDLRKLGYIEGKNLVIERRSAVGRPCPTERPGRRAPAAARAPRRVILASHERSEIGRRSTCIVPGASMRIPAGRSSAGNAARPSRPIRVIR
jgi:putative tryptophan/tyrosine transport system substrate-binding protein